jgi:hypothetical protein
MDLEDNIRPEPETEDAEMDDDELDPEEPLDPLQPADPPEGMGGDTYIDP